MMATTTHIGIMPFGTSQLYGADLTRRVCFIENPTQIKKIGTSKILLNINHFPDSPYSKDLIWYKEQLLKVPVASLRPKVIAIENEAGHYPEKSIEDYCAELAMAVDVFSTKYKVTNSGFTLPLYYWYAKQKPDDAEFFQYCVPDSSKQALIDGKLADRIETCNYELVALTGLKTLFAVNIHYYLRNEGEVEPMCRMIEFVKAYTGKQAISNECGVYAAGLLNNVVSIARQTNMRYCILYSGEGKGGEVPPIALSISEEQYNNAIL